MHFVKASIFIVLHLFAIFLAPAQRKIGFSLPDGLKRLQIPFDEYSNLIVIPITINKMFSVNFILDTGAESAILTEKAMGDLLGLNYVREMTISAPGINDSLEAHVATNVHLSLPFNVQGYGMNMLVLKEDYLELSKTLGEEIYGIIGYDVFSRFVVEIDYENDNIVLYDPNYYKPKKSFTSVPIEVRRTKPFMNTVIQQNGKTDSVTLLVDTGASHAVLLDVDATDQLTLPKKLLNANLGHGLGGEIPGFIGRIDNFSMDQYSFEEVLAAIPKSGSYIKAIKRGSRHGTVGGEALSRFLTIIDYPHERIYLKKSAKYKIPFEFDMSGLHLAAKGFALDSLVVDHVRPKTPASKAGIREGDYIVSLNGMSLANTKLSVIHAFLKKKDGLKIRMVLNRNGRKVKKRFRLKRMI